MRRTLVGAALAAGCAASAFLGTGQVQASKSFQNAARMKCEKCHTQKDEKKMSKDDLTDCGKAAQKVLVAAGLKGHIKDEADGKQWADKLKGFKCP